MDRSQEKVRKFLTNQLKGKLMATHSRHQTSFVERWESGEPRFKTFNFFNFFFNFTNRTKPNQTKPNQTKEQNGQLFGLEFQVDPLRVGG